MSDTYKHKAQYLGKQYWREDEWKPLKCREIILWEPEKNLNNGEIMNKLLGNYVEVEYTLERPRDSSHKHKKYLSNSHKYCSVCHGKEHNNRKKYWRHYLQKKHRRQWRSALKNMDYDNRELDRRPERFTWFID